MRVSRGMETAVEEGIEEMVFDRYKYRGTIHQMQEQKLDRSTSYQGGRSFLDYPPGIQKLSRLRYEKP